ncbi:MAG: tetratricopeptide repeat protein, partial [Bacteroidaceae bacterium]
QGSSNFDRSIEKSEKAIKLHSIRKKPLRKGNKKLSDKKKNWYKQKEFNPFLYHPWMQLGQSQYYKGEYLEAAATFSYITRLYELTPSVQQLARVWMARCYAQLDWFYDAENLLTLVKTEGISKKHKSQYDYSFCNYLIRQGRYEDAIPFLQRVTQNEKRKKQRDRELFLLAQIYQQLGRNEEAYKAYGKIISKSPTYEIELNARIRQTEVLSASQGSKVVRKLKRMSRNLKNKDYLDQIYYAIGNVYLSKTDTIKAMEQYRLASEKSTRNGKEKAIALLSIGGLCWERMEHSEAQKCYKEAMGLIDKEYPNYEALAKRSEVLDELVVHSNNVQLQDSLQHLATLSETEQRKIVLQIIDKLKKKEEEEQKKQKEADLLAAHAADQAANAPTTKKTIAPTIQTSDRSWYFYNTQLLSQGKTTFENTWGNRKLEDNWRRRNKTSLQSSENKGIDYEKEDSIKAKSTIESDSTIVDSIKATHKTDSLANDPHQPEYYLKNIPTTEEMLASSNKILSDALFNMGLIYKDKLEDAGLTQKVWSRLIQQFPYFEHLDEVYYNLYLMYLRYQKQELANQARSTLLTEYPESKYALTIGNPDYLTNAFHGKALEDSLYATTYNAFKKNEFTKVIENDKYAADKYAMGQNRAKFLFLHAMSSLQKGDRSTFMEKLKEVVQKYPQNEITLLATEIMKGLQNGRLLAGGSNFGSIWSLRSSDLANDSLTHDSTKVFTALHDTPYFFLLAYPTGQVDENLLLYEMARFNFATFIVKDFSLSFQHNLGISVLLVKPFNSYEEARYYMHLIYKDANLATRLNGLRPVLISEHNYELLTKIYSFEDYEKFYLTHFTKLPDVNDVGIDPDQKDEFIDEDDPGKTLNDPLQNLPKEELNKEGEYDPKSIPTIKKANQDEFIDENKATDSDSSSKKKEEEFIDESKQLPVTKPATTIEKDEFIDESKQTPTKSVTTKEKDEFID